MNNPPRVLGVRGARVLYKEKINAKRNRKAAIIIIVLNTNLYFNIFPFFFLFFRERCGPRFLFFDLPK